MKKGWILLLSLAVILLIASLFFSPASKPSVQQPVDQSALVQELVKVYSRGGESEKLEELLAELEALDSSAAEKWRQILICWEAAGNHMDIHLEQLPQGLDSGYGLCLIVLGYQLNPDGSMKEELLGRLKTALAAAEGYPQCRILCTGCVTASKNPEVTEADAMAQWLTEQGIPESRLIVENQSMTTGQNAFLSDRLLSEQCPETTQIALITSDYHIPWAVILFEAQLLLSDSSMELASHAAFPTRQRLSDPALLRYQTNGILELISLNP